MKHRSNRDLPASEPAPRPASWRFALSSVAFAIGCLGAQQASALGLGRLTVQSALGETLRAEIEVTSMTAEEAASLRLRVASPDAYRAAGVEYNAALTAAQVQVVRRPDGATVLRVSGDRAVLEPFVDVIIEASWATGRLVREYTLLFDPPSQRVAQAPPPAVAPVVTPPAAAPAPMAAAPAPRATEAPAPRRAPAPLPPPTPPRVAAESSGGAGGADQYEVRSGDTLGRIAGRVQRPGVSLDQMLVSLFRANPQAFSGENMNRLKAGAVLTVPSAESAGQITPQQAREVIVAQSSDFAAYRQRLAAGVGADTTERAPTRQATGQVQTQVEDRKQAGAASPDKLTLSQGGVKPGAAESQASRDAERKDSNTRLAELSRNVKELKELQQGTAAPAPAAPAAPAVAAAPAVPATPPAPAAAPPAPEPPPPAAAAPAPAPVPPAPVVTAPKPPATPDAPAAAAPGWFDSLLENPMLLPGAGVLVVLLAGLGLYRLRGRRKSGGETSFLESRLQPDSFFGASGGQRIDTREAASSQGSSSMSYSLSQLDAIGDVDPVAEADVYLAYGRDLQAEEILKEAMRANPERMAIRAKLLEVYAKRRDTKGFELLATQMHNLTRGEGEDWTKAQELGRTIDPENPLYQPGGKPETVLGSAGQPVEALGASTVPYTAPMTAPSFQPAVDATLDGGAAGIDLDLDIAGGTVPVAPPRSAVAHDATQPISTGASLSAPGSLDFELDAATIPVSRPKSALPPVPPPPPSAGGLDFDLGDIGGAPAPAAASPSGPSSDFGEFQIGGEAIPSTLEDGDPLERKLELAEEFRQIGDLEGARDLLEEVVSKSSGTLRSKAQTMLDSLA